MLKYEANIRKSADSFKKITNKLLPLDLMKLTIDDLDKQFVVNVDKITIRDLIFKFYEQNDCKVFNLAGNNSTQFIYEVITELPPIYIFHTKLSLILEKFSNLSNISVLNAIYEINADELLIDPESFCENLYKVIEADLQIYFTFANLDVNTFKKIMEEKFEDYDCLEENL